MKTIYKLSLFISILAMVTISCKNESPKHSTEGTTIPKNEDLTNTTNYKDNTNLDGSGYDLTKETDSVNENWNLDSPKRQERLYAEFNFTKEQITDYETAIENWKKSDTENPYEKLSSDERIMVEDSILKNILDDTQYDSYKDWADAVEG